MRALALLLLLAVGCTSTTYARPGSVTAQAWLAQHPSAEVEVEVADAPADRTKVTVVARSPTDVWLVAPDGNTLSLDRVRKVVAVRRDTGAFDGMLLGLAVGALGGAVLGATQTPSPSDCWAACTRGETAALSAILFGAMGLVVGTPTGALIGTRDVLDLR